MLQTYVYVTIAYYCRNGQRIVRSTRIFVTRIRVYWRCAHDDRFRDGYYVHFSLLLWSDPTVAQKVGDAFDSDFAAGTPY